MGTGGAAPHHRGLTPREEEAARAKGDAAERKVLAVLARIDRPDWIIRVRRARMSEDRGGVDVVINTSTGRVYLQVKSSWRRAAEWRRQHALDERPIGLVVVGVDDDMATIYGRVLGALILLRERQENGITTGLRS